MNNEVIIDGPVDLLNNIPSLLGFKPRNTLIVVGTNSPHDKLVKTLTIPFIEFEENPELVQEMLKNKFSEVCDSVVLVFYMNEGFQFEASFIQLEDYATELFDKIQVEINLGVRDVLWVKENKWASFICQDKNCCPKGGRELQTKEREVDNEIIDEVLTMVDKCIGSTNLNERDVWMSEMIKSKNPLELNRIANTIVEYMDINKDTEPKERLNNALGIACMFFYATGNTPKLQAIIGEQITEINRLAGLITRSVLMNVPFNKDILVAKEEKKKKKKTKVVQ
jgi:hypothetical protein